MEFAHFAVEARRLALARAEKSKIDGSGHRHRPSSVVPDHRPSFSGREWFGGLETDGHRHVSGKAGRIVHYAFKGGRGIDDHRDFSRLSKLSPCPLHDAPAVGSNGNDDARARKPRM